MKQCIVCGEKDRDECPCTKEELLDRVEGLANLMISFATLVSTYSPMAINVANDMLKQHKEDQANMKEKDNG